jgi:hypothetical protein
MDCMVMRITGLTAFLGLAGAAHAQPTVNFSPGQHGQIEFVMPSKNIGCTYTPKGGTPMYKPLDGGPELTCDRIEPRYVRLVLTPFSLQRFDNVGDQGCCGAANIFPYGSRWVHGPFTCESDQSGLSCSRPDGSGFSVSRASIMLF